MDKVGRMEGGSEERRKGQGRWRVVEGRRDREIERARPVEGKRKREGGPWRKGLRMEEGREEGGEKKSEGQ